MINTIYSIRSSGDALQTNNVKSSMQFWSGVVRPGQLFTGDDLPDQYSLPKTFHTDWRGRTSERTFVPAFRKGMSHHLQFVIVIIILKFLPSTSAACA